MCFFFLGCPSCFASCLVLPCTFHWYTGTVYVLALSFMIVLCRSWQPMFPVPPLPCAIFMFHCSHGFSCNLSSHVPSLCSFAHWFSYGVTSCVPSISYCTLHIPIIYPSTILQIVNMAQMYTFTCAILQWIPISLCEAQGHVRPCRHLEESSLDYQLVLSPVGLDGALCITSSLK